jgi:hypothetical protein
MRARRGLRQLSVCSRIIGVIAFAGIRVERPSCCGGIGAGEEAACGGTGVGTVGVGTGKNIGASQ